MKSTLLIPKLCKVGFNIRQDTYTGKLGYIIMHDGKTWRKEPSWESWREKYISDEEFQQKKLESFNQTRKSYEDSYNAAKASKTAWQHAYYTKFSTVEEMFIDRKIDTMDNYVFRVSNHSNDQTIEPVEFDNIPTEGFVLNKKAGGYSTGWNHRSTYCRVYDPRGWEFEITIPNLLYILDNSTSIKGKGLSGNFVYSWDGKDLVLVPEEAPEYKEMVEFTQLQDLKVSSKDLVPGGVYLHKDGGEKTYLGFSDLYDHNGVSTGKKHWWYYQECPYGTTVHDRFGPLELSNVKKFIRQSDDYPELMERLSEKSNYKKKEIEHVQLTEVELSAGLHKGMGTSQSYYSYYGNRNTMSPYILEGKKYRQVSLEHRVGTREKDDYHITIGRKEILYPTIKQLLNNHTLWQPRTTE